MEVTISENGFILNPETSDRLAKFKEDFIRTLDKRVMKEVEKIEFFSMSEYVVMIDMFMKGDFYASFIITDGTCYLDTYKVPFKFFNYLTVLYD